MSADVAVRKLNSWKAVHSALTMETSLGCHKVDAPVSSNIVAQVMKRLSFVELMDHSCRLFLSSIYSVDSQILTMGQGCVLNGIDTV